MKIAVQISGLLRDFQESYRSLQRSLLDHYDCDIFVAAATGDDRFASDQDIVREIGAKAYVLNNDLPSNFGEMVKEWNDTIAWSVTGLNIFTRVASVYAALFKRWQANELRLRSDTHYDAVLVTRADIVYGEPFTDDVLEATQTHLMIPRHGDWHGGFNDHFFLARPKHATTATMQYAYYPETCEALGVPHPERNWRYHLQNFKIPVGRFNYTYYLRVKDQRFRDIRGN